MLEAAGLALRVCPSYSREYMRPCWIVTYMRSGSTYLCRLLNSTGTFDPIFCEHYIGGKSKMPPELPPAFNKMMNFQYMVESRRYTVLHEYYPNMAFVYLRRRDIVAATISQYFIAKTKIANINQINAPKRLSNYQELDIGYNKSRLIKLYYHKLVEYHFWDHFLQDKEHLEVYTKTFLVPEAQVARIMDFIGVDFPWGINWEDPSLTAKLEHPKKEEYTAWLRYDLTTMGIIAP